MLTLKVLLSSWLYFLVFDVLATAVVAGGMMAMKEARANGTWARLKARFYERVAKEMEKQKQGQPQILEKL